MGLTILTIHDDDHLYRRVYRDHFGRAGEVLSVAFKFCGKPDHHISVDLARLTSPDEAVSRDGASSTTHGLGVLVARHPRGLGFAVNHSPLPNNRAHSLIEGENDKQKCRLLAQHTTVLLRPGD